MNLKKSPKAGLRKKSLPLILLLLVITVAAGSSYILPHLLSAYLSSQLKADVRIKDASLNIRDGIRAKGILISNKRGLVCNIEKALIQYNIISLVKEGINFSFNFENVDLSYPNSKIITAIAGTLSVNPAEMLQFDSVKGKFYSSKNETIIKSLYAEGKFIRLFIDATITDNKRIDCGLKMLLSGKLIADIPESTKNLFFKKDGAWSEAELYLTGDINRPSINFSTDLFRLVVR